MLVRPKTRIVRNDPFKWPNQSEAVLPMDAICLEQQVAKVIWELNTEFLPSKRNLGPQCWRSKFAIWCQRFNELLPHAANP